MAVGPQEIRRITGLIQRTRRQFQNGLGRIGLARREAVAIEFEKQNPDDKAGALVAVDERVIAHDARRISRRLIEQVGCIRIGLNLLRPGEGGLQQGRVPPRRRAAVQRQQAIMQREGVPLFKPPRFGHWARTCNVLR